MITWLTEREVSTYTLFFERIYNKFLTVVASEKENWRHFIHLFIFLLNLFKKQY